MVLLVLTSPTHALPAQKPGSWAVQAGIAVRRAGRGGLLSGLQVIAVSGLAVGASRLRSSVNATIKRAEQTSQDIRMQPLQSIFRVLSPILLVLYVFL